MLQSSEGDPESKQESYIPGGDLTTQPRLCQ